MRYQFLGQPGEGAGSVDGAECTRESADQATLQQLVRRLTSSHFRSQIVGPHGSGKSTLVTDLARQLAAAGYRLFHFQLLDGQRKLPRRALDSLDVSQPTFVIVDGYEQLSWFQRRCLQRSCRRTASGLLVTTHRRVKLPVLWQTTTSLSLLKQLVAQLTSNCPSSRRLTAAQIERAYHAHGSNLREALFQLYDDFANSTDDCGDAPDK